ncbi:hypothetical protein [Bowmanella denitrificans]|uniref:hypothetical protein n=1 Tax=Bowmanella denitrificans TaxID=366582 RepID=UPI0011AF87EB|nr:hypothetical protein [Bowmanella denitrificans]
MDGFAQIQKFIVPSLIPKANPGSLKSFFFYHEGHEEHEEWTISIVLRALRALRGEEYFEKKSGMEPD